MVDQDFVSGTVISSAWLNGINDSVKDMYGTTQFNLYVAVSGDDSNDGLTVSTPFATLQKAFDTLMEIGNVGGQRTINIAAGTYNTSANRTARLGPANENETDPDVDTYASDGVNSVNYIVVQGPDVGYDPLTNPWPTPTAIFDGGSAAAFGLQIEGPIKVLVKNLKFKNATGYGVSGDGSELRCENVHTEGCNIGISSVHGNMEVRGGDIYGNAGKTLTGIRSLFVNRHAIGYQGALGAGQGPRIRYCNLGILAQESATGHADSVSFEDCNDAIRVTVNSRVNYSYSDFKRCTRAVRCDFNSVVFGYDDSEFNDGTADANDEKIVISTGGRSVDRDTYGISPLATDFLIAPVTHTGTLASTAIFSKTLGAGEFAPVLYTTRKPQMIKFVAWGSQSGTAGTKQYKVRMGSTILASITNSATDAGDWRVSGEVIFSGYNTQMACIIYWPHASTSVTRTNNDTGTDDMRAASKTLSFEVQLNDVADTIIVEGVYFEVWG